MNSERVVQLYIDEVIKRLPFKQRRDIAGELRSLIAEELAAKGEALGRAPDEAMAVDFLRDFGRPQEVATRYQPSFTIIDPSDTRDFLVAAVIGSLILGQTYLIFGWLGLLGSFFGIRNWVRRRWPEKSVWRPQDPDRASRLGSLALVVLIIIGILSFGAPQWVFAQLSGGKVLSPWLAYTDNFHRTRLPWLFAVWALSGVLRLMVAFEGQWRSLTRYVDIGISALAIVVLAWFCSDGSLFRTPIVDHDAKTGIAVAVLIVMIDIVEKTNRLRRLRFQH
jgi:hypothetical protein